MTALVLLMAAVCLAPVAASLIVVALGSGARTNKVLIGSLGATFGFLLGLVAVFLGVMLPLSSTGLSGQPHTGSASLVEAVRMHAGIAALAAAVVSTLVTMRLAKGTSGTGK